MLLTLAIAAVALFNQTPPQAPKAAQPPAVAQGPQTVTIQETCTALTLVNNEPVMNPFPALKLAALTASTGLPALPIPNAQGVRCERSAFGLGEQDYRVLTEYRLPLFIVSAEAAGVLEMVEGNFQLRMLNGGLTEQGVAAFRGVLDRSAVAANAAAARTSPASQPAAQKQGSRPSAAPAQAKQPARR